MREGGRDRVRSWGPVGRRRAPAPSRAGLRLLALVGLGALLLGAPGPGRALAPGVLKATFFALDRGEATLVEGPHGRVCLVGGGAPGEGPEVARRVRARGVRSVPVVIVQTWKPAHVGGIRPLLTPLRVERVLFNAVYAPGPECDSLFRHCRSLGEAGRLLFQSLTPGEEVTLSHQPLFQMTAHSPTGAMIRPYALDPKCSLVAEFGVQKASFLSLGDTTARIQREYWRQRDPKPWGHLLHLGRAVAADTLAAEHLRALRTKVAILTLPRKGGGAPNAALVAALRKAGVRVYRTDRDGTLTATVTEGGTVTVARGG